MATIFRTFFKPRADDCTTKQLILLKGMFFLKFCTNDYITIIYLAWGPVSHFQTNPVILEVCCGSKSGKAFLLLVTTWNMRKALVRPASGALSAHFWCLCQKRSLSPLHCKKTFATQSSEWLNPSLWSQSKILSFRDHEFDTDLCKPSGTKRNLWSFSLTGIDWILFTCTHKN